MMVGCSHCLTSTTSQLKNHKGGDLLPTGVAVVNPEQSAIIFGSGACENVIKSTDFVYKADRTWRMKRTIKEVNGPFGGRAHLKAVTRSYKKVNGRNVMHKLKLIQPEQFGMDRAQVAPLLKLLTRAKRQEKSRPKIIIREK